MRDNKSNFKKGAVELLILHLLDGTDCYGYQLTQLIEEHSGGILAIQEGTLYPTLYKLSDKGYISEHKKLVGKRKTRVYYHLEDEGRDRLAELSRDYFEVNRAIQKVLNYTREENDGSTE